LEHGFAILSDFKLHGTIVAGNSSVFQMMMPTNEKVDGDVASYFTRKGYNFIWITGTVCFVSLIYLFFS
jgi:hypothetical protein